MSLHDSWPGMFERLRSPRMRRRSFSPTGRKQTYWGYIGFYIRVILRSYWGYIRVVLGFIFGLYWG